MSRRSCFMEWGIFLRCASISSETFSPSNAGWPVTRLVENAAERIEIGAVVDGQALELFRRHVVDRAHERVEVVDRLRLRRVEIFGQAEVEDLDVEERASVAARAIMKLPGLRSR